MAQSQPKKATTSGLATNILLVAAGLMLISFGATRLEAGTSGLTESITLSACIVSGLCLLAAVSIGLRKARNNRVGTR